MLRTDDPDLYQAAGIGFEARVFQDVNRNCVAWLVYRYLGLKFLSRSWFNLDATWAVSLILVGTIALLLSLAN